MLRRFESCRARSLQWLSRKALGCCSKVRQFDSDLQIVTRPLRKESPLLSFLNSAFVDLPAPSNLSYFWGFGSLLGLCLVSQMATGVLLAMHFCPEEALAFSSVVLLTQESYVLRLWHSNGTSVFFLLVFLHIGRGLYFASYLKRAVWNLGVFLFVVMMATSFIGYVLPWGQMSF